MAEVFSPTTGTAPNQAFSAQNVAQTVSAPIPAPDYSDPLKLRDYFYNTPDIQAERTGLSELNKQLANLRTNTRAQQNYIEDRTVPLDIIRGEQASQLRLASASEQSLAEQIGVKQANLNTFLTDADQRFQLAYQQRSQIEDLIRQTGGKAKISYTDTYESAVSKAQKYVEKQAKEQKKEAEKDALKDMYFQLTGKVAKKGLSSGELKKAVSKAGASKKAIEAELQQLELASKRKSLAGSGTTNTTALNSLLEKAANLPSGGREWAASVAKTYGVSPDAVLNATAKDGWEQAYKTTTAAQQTAAAKTEAAKQSAQYQASNALQAVNKLAEMPGLGAAVGPISSKLPTFRGETADFEREVERVKSLITLPELQNLRGLGAMSDREFATLSAAASSLNLNMSEEGFRRELSRIQETLGNAINKAQTITSPQMSTIPVIDIQTGMYGTIPENEFDSSRYIRQ